MSAGGSKPSLCPRGGGTSPPSASAVSGSDCPWSLAVTTAARKTGGPGSAPRPGRRTSRGQAGRDGGAGGGEEPRKGGGVRVGGRAHVVLGDGPAAGPPRGDPRRHAPGQAGADPPEGRAGSGAARRLAQELARRDDPTHGVGRL